jgi:protein-tyrosine-phosphatase
MAEALMVHHGWVYGVDVAASSASVDDEQRATHPLVLQLLDERGLSLESTQSQPLAAEIVDRADLVLTMTGQHAIAVAARFRAAKTKVFMLDHFVQIAPPRREHQSVEDWLARVRKRPRSYPSQPGAQDVPDPIGKDIDAFRETCDQLDTLTGQLVRAVIAG